MFPLEQKLKNHIDTLLGANPIEFDDIRIRKTHRKHSVKPPSNFIEIVFIGVNARQSHKCTANDLEFELNIYMQNEILCSRANTKIIEMLRAEKKVDVNFTLSEINRIGETIELDKWLYLSTSRGVMI